MVYRWIIVLILFGLTGIPSFSQKTSPPKTAGPSAEQKERDTQIRNQALYLLRDNLSRARSISDLSQRAYVIVEASTVLWDYDRPTAQDYLVGFINQCLADYKDLLAKEKRTNEEQNDLEDIRHGIRQGLKALTRRDPKGASVLLSKYFKTQEDALKAKNLSEEMEMAAEGVDVDEQRTVDLLNAIISQGIPREFPRLINTLKTTKPLIANSLIQRAIQNIAVNPNYKASDAINLSAVIFNENQYPIPILSDPADPNNWGTMMYTSLEIKNPTGREVISSYLAAVQGFFNSRVMDRSAGVFDSNQNLLQACYLLEKLKAYAVVYNVANPEVLDQGLIPVLDAMRTAGFSDQSLTEIKKRAYLQATKNSPVDLDDGTRAFDKADEAKTPEEKMKYLIEGIIAAIEFRQFAKLEWKIQDIQNAEIKDALFLLLDVRVSLDAIENRNWSEFEKRTEKISDKRIRAFLYIKAISVLEPGKNSRTLLTEYVIKAEKNINFISDKTAKACALMTLTSLLFAFENTETMRDVPSALFGVNEAPNYQDNYQFSINVTIPARRSDQRGEYNFGEYMGEDSFKNVFSKLAETDWTNAQVQALQVKRLGLQAIAQIVAAKTVLNKKTFLK